MPKKPKAPKTATSPTTPRTKDDLRSDFQSQYHFLKKSSQDFDQGDHREALRIAVALRVLIHHTSQSHSLLEQCGLASTLQFVDTVGRKPEGIISFGGLAWMVLGIPPRFMAPLSKAKVFKRLPLNDWWTIPVMRMNYPDSREFVEMSRKVLVLALAYKDGGAHVDPNPDSVYYALTRDSLIGEVAIEGKLIKWDSNPVPHAVRQIAHEVMTTIEEQAADLLPIDTSNPR